MQPQPTPARLAPSPAGVLVVDGYGVRIHVHHGRLLVADGTGPARRLGEFERATARLHRLVLLGHTGSITIDALRWLSDVGVGFTAIDTDGRLLAASGNLGRDDPRLRRAQAIAIDTPLGNDVARRLIAEKIAAQAQTLAALIDVVPVSDEPVLALREAAARLHIAASRDEIRLAEAQAAAAYWAAWADVPVAFTRRDAERVPAHWRRFGSRSSPITGNPRLAGNPANALLNYLYAVLEAEARLACLAVGLDPGLGVLHSDLKARDSLALDVMEPVRPQVDAFVLVLLRRQVFRAADFHQTRQGVCRVLEPLTHRLGETAPTWARALGPVVEQVARLLLDGAGAVGDRPPTPLTGANRSAGRPAGGRPPGAKRSPARPLTRPVPCCEHCGADLPTGRRRLCGACRPGAVEEQRVAFRAAGAERLGELRAQGRNPGTGGAAGRERGRKIAASRRAARVWEVEHPGPWDPDNFQRDILPGLAGVTPHALASATGLSRPYCAAVLRGERVPHPRWWGPLKALGERLPPGRVGGSWGPA